jgi:hypothetical protein
MGGCLLNPHSKLLPQAKASMVSKGKLLLVIEGTKVQIIKCVDKKINNFLFIVIYLLLYALLLIDT